MKYIGKKIQRIKKTKGYNISSAAALSGITEEKWTGIEKGIILPDLEALEKMADTLSVDITDITEPGVGNGKSAMIPNEIGVMLDLFYANKRMKKRLDYSELIRKEKEND